MSGIVGDNTGRSSGLVKGVATPSSDFVLISTTTGTGTVSFDGDFSSTYDNYLLVGYGIDNDGSDEDLRMRVRQADSDVTASSYYRVWNGNYGTNVDGQARYDGADYAQSYITIINNWDDAAAKPTQFNMWIYNPFQGSTYHYITWHATNVSPNTTASYMNFSGFAHYYGNTTALSGLSFYSEPNGNITAANFKLYGLK